MTTQTTSTYDYDSVTRFMKNYRLDNTGGHYAVDDFEAIENKDGQIEIFFQSVGDNENIINMYPDANYSGYGSEKLPITINNNYNIKNIYLTTFDNGRIVVFYINGDCISYIYENKNTGRERWILGDEKFALAKDIYDEENGIGFTINEIRIKTIIMDDREVIEISPIYYSNPKKEFDNTVNSNNRKNIINKSKINKAGDNCKKILNFTNEKTDGPNINYEMIALSAIGAETNSILIGNTYDTLTDFNITYAYDPKYVFICHSFSVENRNDSHAYYYSEDSILDSKIEKIEKLKSIEYYDNGEVKSKIYCKIYTEELHQYIVSLRIDGDRVLVDKVISEIDLNITPKGRDIFDFKISLDSKNRTHLFLDYNEDKRRLHESILYHMMEDDNSPTGWSDPTRINTQVMSYDNTVYNTLSVISGGINVFFVDKNNTFIRSMWSLENDQWIDSNITPGSKTVTKEFSVYSSEISVKDKFGILLINEPVEISSSAQTGLIINGSTYFVEKDQKISIKTNIRGVFTITQPAENLGVAALSFTLPQRDPSPVAIRQYADVKDRLSKLTAQDLKDAKDSKGNLLVPDLSTDSAESIVSSVKKCMEMADTAPKLRRTLKKEPHVGKYLPETLLQLETLQAPKQYQSWMLDLNNNTPIYRELNKDMHQKEIDNLLDFDPIEWFGSIGDFIKNGMDKVIDVLKIIADSTADGFSVTIHFVEDGIEKFFTAVIKVALDAINIASVIFNDIKLTTDKLIEWIGFVFDWDDILRTKEAISHILSLQKEFLTKSTEKIKRTVDNTLSSTKNKVNKVFDDLINTYQGKSVNYGYNQVQSLKNNFSPKGMDKALANNPLFDYLYNPINYNKLSESLNAVQSRFISIDNDNSPADQVREAIDKYTDDFKNSDDMNSLNVLFSDTQNTESLFSKMIADILGILKNLTTLAINGLTSLVDSVISFVETAISKLYTIMNEPLYIPFISEIFKFITKAEKDPSMNDFLSLLLAIPITILSKLILNKSLLPDKESVLNFKTEINITDLLEIVNSTYNDSMIITQNTGKTKRKKRSTTKSSGSKNVLKWISAFCTLFSGFVEGLRAGSLIIAETTYPNNTRLSTIKKFINCFAIVINATNIICQLLLGSLDAYSALLIAMSFFMLVLLIIYTVASFFEKNAYDIHFIVLSIIFGSCIFFLTFFYMKQLSGLDITISFLFAAWQILDGTVLLRVAPPVSIASVAIQCLLGITAGGIKIVKIVE
ncbi:hypothetical protein [Xenorhabdus kozodoii]|uniref:Uncharacterized protein n=1 Tax=Xenorhabdus kozodoii TaxID=351676 RepID=A0A2D0LDV8_9GAMM|nr:hypothetical protein [Xenorhabdus kozodoii]PHM73851.1 hypothetical protein Xkoz_01355 [Xenorhabdus kozodoii]